MSINLVRSPRKTEFWSQTTPQVVGPGYYVNNKSFNDGQRENVAPFLSLKERKINDPYSENPGPGAYDSLFDKSFKADDRQNNIFVTKVPRFCPTAPGSTVFKPPSSIYNPGPGTYQKQIKWNQVSSMTRIKQNYDSNIHKDLVIKPQGRAPSIPAKKMSQIAYSGLGQDTVGPACYNPKEQSVKVRNRQADFISTKIPRKVFEPNKTRENDLPSKENPGPGQYDIGSNMSTINQKQPTSVFVSKVPNCKDIKIKSKDAPGPGYYEKANDTSFLSDHKRSLSETGGNSVTGIGSVQNKNNVNFLSTTKREDFWVNDMKSPFMHPTNFQNPGPGKYHQDKKKDDIRSKILNAENLPPFGAGAERDCNRKPNKNQNPGPGTYIDINNPIHSSVQRHLVNITSDRNFVEANGVKLGAFGSNQERFFKGPFEGKPEDEGSQYKDLKKASDFKTFDNKGGRLSSQNKDYDRPNTQSVYFKSTTERFMKIDAQNPHIRILEAAKAKRTASQGQDNKPGSAMNISSQSTRVGTGGVVSYLSKGPQWTRQTRAGDYEVYAGKRVGFDATSPRFNYNQVFYGQSLKFEVPGPGQYTNENGPQTAMNFFRPNTYSQPRNKNLKYAVVFNTCEKRFKNKGINSYIYQPGTTQVVGPGSYINNENSMLKKSFNMSMEHSYFL